MVVIIETKDVGDVKDCYKRECEVVRDRNEDYIKKELVI